MSKDITRREAIREMLLAGAGIAVSGSLLDACARRGGNAALADAVMEPAPEGSRIDAQTWRTLGETIGMLGLGCMRLPTVGGGAAGFGVSHLDQEAVNAMVDYAIAHGVNYFDTAPAYGESEVVTGNALKRHPRESFKIATKLSNFAYGAASPSLEDGKKMFETSLKNLQVDYVDFLLLHAVNSTDELESRFIKNGLLDYLKEQKAAGRIKHLGFSFHGDNAALPAILDKGNWDFVQIQLNYLDWKDMGGGFGGGGGQTSAESLYNTLVARNIPIVVMEPVKGGALATVSDALKARMQERHPGLSPAANALSFVGSLRGVMVTLSGMSNMDQLKENVALFTDFKPFKADDLAFMQTIADLYKANTHIPCTGCAYCMPCPHGVNIPGNFKAYNTASDNLNIPDPANKGKDYNKQKKAFLKLYNELPVSARADMCVNCNACVPKCPQHIRIPGQLNMIRELVSKL